MFAAVCNIIKFAHIAIDMIVIVADIRRTSTHWARRSAIINRADSAMRSAIINAIGLAGIAIQMLTGLTCTTFACAAELSGFASDIMASAMRYRIFLTSAIECMEPRDTNEATITG